MTPTDYAFTKTYGYNVDERKYDKHRFYEYDNFIGVKSLFELLRRMEEFNDPSPEAVWKVVVRNNTRPIISLDVRNYEEPYDTSRERFLVDTGADVSILTDDTADNLGVCRLKQSGEAEIINGGIEGGKGIYLCRWIYIFLGGKLHPTPILVHPRYNSESATNHISLKHNILGRATITNCFLICFDNKRLHTFVRRNSEPLKR